MRYKRRGTIEAERFDGSEQSIIDVNALGVAFTLTGADDGHGLLHVPGHPLQVPRGHWVVVVNGQHFSMSPKLFDLAYEPVDEHEFVAS